MMIQLLALTVPLATAGPLAGSGTNAPAMSAAQALALGLVEGVTEYLPVSSTGHLLLAQRLLGLGSGAAADAYAVCIQAGAILAVLGLYAPRIRDIILGMIGRNPGGRRLGLALVVAFVPAAVLGVLLGDTIKAHLFGHGDLGLRPVAWAWILGGVAIIAFQRHMNHAAAGGARGRSGLDAMTLRMALIIGVCQCAALWPGVSRSLATILGGSLAGLTLVAAVEFSFLLGLATLSASTLFDGWTHGGDMLAAYGWGPPLWGLLAALVSAVLAVRWLVSYLQRNPMTVFGWYRIALGALTLIFS